MNVERTNRRVILARLILSIFERFGVIFDGDLLAVSPAFDEA